MRPDHDAGHFAHARSCLDWAVMHNQCAYLSGRIRRVALRGGAWLFGCALAWSAAAPAATAVYRWVDANGVTHLSSDRPPAGVKYEALKVPTSSGSSTHRSGTSGGKTTRATSHLAAATPEQVARRNSAISELQNRECVVALEAIDRMARGGQAVDAAEFRRLQQTTDANCSTDPARRQEQEAQAAKLRVARGDACVEARNQLADLLEPGRKPTRAQLKAQQEFIEAHCTAPVR